MPVEPGNGRQMYPDNSGGESSPFSLTHYMDSGDTDTHRHSEWPGRLPGISRGGRLGLLNYLLCAGTLKGGPLDHAEKGTPARCKRGCASRCVLLHLVLLRSFFIGLLTRLPLKSGSHTYFFRCCPNRDESATQRQGQCRHLDFVGEYDEDN